MTLLKRARMAAGQTQGQVAKRVGVSVAAYSGWETGRWLPHPKNVVRLGRVLSIPPDKLMDVLVPEPKAHPGDGAIGRFGTVAGYGQCADIGL